MVRLSTDNQITLCSVDENAVYAELIALMLPPSYLVNDDNLCARGQIAVIFDSRCVELFASAAEFLARTDALVSEIRPKRRRAGSPNRIRPDHCRRYVLADELCAGRTPKLKTPARTKKNALPPRKDDLLSIL